MRLLRIGFLALLRAFVLLHSRVGRGFGSTLLPLLAAFVAAAAAVGAVCCSCAVPSACCGDVTAAMFSLEFDCSELLDWRRGFFTIFGGFGFGSTFRALFGVTLTCMK